MGSGQSNQNNNEKFNEQAEQQQQTNIYSVALRSQIVKKRIISQDDDDDDEDDEEEEEESNVDSENEEQQFETNEDEEYVQGDKLVDNKYMYSGFLVNRNQLLAIKKIVLNKKENHKIIKYNLQQITYLKHENLDSIISWNFENSNNNKKNYYLNIFYNFESNGSLQSLLLKYCKFSQDLILTIFKQILKALEYLHSQNKLHRNLKTSNILVDHKGAILLSDILIQSQYSLSNYSAPETYVYADYSEASDIWSAGCIFYELLTKKQPWQINQKVLSIQEIKKRFSQNQSFLKENLDIQKNSLNILQQIFQFQPEDRPSASQLLKHQIFLENSSNKFKQMAKQISQKEEQNTTPQKKLISLIQDFQGYNNLTNQPVQQIKLKKKENDEISFDIKECVLNIQSNILKEFTISQNSNSYFLTKYNFESLTYKQQQFSNNLIQQKLCHNKQSYRIQETSNLSQVVSQMKTAINFQGSYLQSQNSTSEKNFDQKSNQINLLTQSFNQLNQEIKQSQQIQDNKKDLKLINNEQIQKQSDLVKTQAEITINKHIHCQETEQIYFDEDFVFIL